MTREPLLPPVNAHRRLRGPYTAAGTIMRALVPDALARVPDLVAAHDIEILSAAPELRDIITPRFGGLPSLVMPEENTRFFSTLRTLRVAHGLTEFLRDYLSATGSAPVSLTLWCLDEADPTDQEFVSVLRRRLDVELVVGACPASGSAAGHVAAHCVGSDPAARAAYDRLPDRARRELHDARAEELARTGEYSWRLGAIPFHLERGSDASGRFPKAAREALGYCVNMGFYEAAVDFGRRGRKLVDWTADTETKYWLTTRLATSLISLGRPAEADELYEETRRNTVDPGVHMGTAYASAILHTRHYEEERRDHLRARGWLNQAIAITELLPDSERLELQRVFNKVGLALIENHLGNRQAALRLVSEGMALIPAADSHKYRLHRSVLHLRRVQIYAALGRMDDAVAEYRIVLEADPYYPEYHFDLANMLREMDREDEAIAEYEAVISLSPAFKEAHYNRADIREARGDLKGARADLEYVLEVDPDYVDAYINLTSVLMQLDCGDEASRAVAAGLAIAPGNPHLLCLRGQLELAGGRLDPARIALDGAVEADPSLAEAWATRGALAFESGDHPAALVDLSRAWDLSQDPAILFNRATVYDALGDWGRAIADLDRVLDDDPAELDALLIRAFCHARDGDLAAARGDARSFVSQAPDRAAEVSDLLGKDDAGPVPAR
jgi:tetratricopeptide (TPR) repeat protein